MTIEQLTEAVQLLIERVDGLENQLSDLSGQLDFERGRARTLENDLARAQTDLYALERATPGRGW